MSSWPDMECPQRRHTDASALTRATGHSGRQMMIQVLGGLLIAGVVGGISVWGTSLVLGERLANLSDQLHELKNDVKTIRSDLYRPRIGGDAAAVPILPARQA